MSEKELVFLLEEPSAKAMLESLLPRILNPSITPRLIPFDGKQDLEKQMVKRIRSYLNPNARFIVMRDQDSVPDCTVLKNSLLARCQESGRQPTPLVRIACRELESFYLADLSAVEQAMEIKGLAKQQNGKKFRSPDYLSSPSKELANLTKQRYQKVSDSRIIGLHLDIDNQRSTSFKNLIAGIRRLEQELIQISPNY
jgi:hypothetical protein